MLWMHISFSDCIFSTNTGSSSKPLCLVNWNITLSYQAIIHWLSKRGLQPLMCQNLSTASEYDHSNCETNDAVITAKHGKAILDCQLVMKSNYSITGRSRHKYHFCCHKTFVTAIICHDKHNFVTTKLLLQQAYFCCDKPVFYRDNSMLVATKLLLSVTTNICHEKSFVATK